MGGRECQVQVGAGEETGALNRYSYGKEMELDPDGLPNWRFHEAMGLDFPIWWGAGRAGENRLKQPIKLWNSFRVHVLS